jgi:hypothetical protein
MVARLVTGILALVFLPLGVVFVVIGLVVDEPDRGSPEVFVYLGIPLALVGLACAAWFAVLQRREAARRSRRRAGLRATVEIVGADFNPSVRSGSKLAMKLTVRFPTAGTASGTVSTTLMVAPPGEFLAGRRVEILYDPQDPANFEPVAGTAV